MSHQEKSMPLKLIIANKAYSSWSMRPWILLAQLQIPFEEVVIPMDQPDTRKRMLKYAPTAKCPSLHDGAIHVWESLAIVEYIAEKYPKRPVWPSQRAARALARALANEMHAGFGALRQHLPMNVRRPVSRRALTPQAQADVERVEAIFAKTRALFGKGGGFLFGRFSAADAMFAPVVSRLHTYDVAVRKPTRAYMDTIMALPAWQAWIDDAMAEPWQIAAYEGI
jgi:glutathione S-transferase